MEGESAEGTRRNVAKRFSPRGTAQKKKPQFNPITKSKSDKLTRLSGDKSVDDHTNQEGYEISNRIQGTSIVEIIEPKLGQKLLQYMDERKLKPTTAIAHEVLRLIFSEVKSQRHHAEVNL